MSRSINRVPAKMNLAILGSRGIPATYGGFETFAEELSVGLSSRGIDVTVYCQTTQDRAPARYKQVNLEYIPLPPVPKQLQQVIWDAHCLWLARRSFDVVYMLGVAGAFMCWAPRMHGSEVWVSTDGLESKRGKWNGLQKTYLQFAEAIAVMLSTKVIADSEAIAAHLRGRYGRLARVRTVAYGAYPVERAPDDTALAKWGIQRDSYYLTVCRLEPENHVLEKIQGYLQSSSPHPLLVLGSTLRGDRYVQQLLSYACDRVRFIGPVYDPVQLVPLRYYSRAYLHGHSVGGTNPSLLEAMACSNLVIAHDNAFNREVLGATGLFFKTSEEIATHLARIESGQVPVEAMRRAAVDVIRTRYRWHDIVSFYEQLLTVATCGHKAGQGLYTEGEERA